MSITAEELRSMSYEEVEKKLSVLEAEYMQVRQQAHSKTAERGDIKEAKKSVARCKNIMREMKLKALVEEYKGKKELPKMLRPKLTKALRMKLTPAQKALKTKSQRLHQKKYPKKIFSLRN
ncbi:60S ribosomal protein L35 [Glugoides intestinalis]